MYPICLDRVSSTVVFSRAQATQFGRTDLASFCHVPWADCGAGVGANYPIQWYLAFQREVHWSSKCPVTRAQIVDNIPLLYKISKAVNTKFHLGFAVLPVSAVVVLGRFFVKEDKTELAFGVAFGSLILFIISLVLLIFHIQAVTAAYTLYEVRDRERETRGHIHARTHTHSLSRALSLFLSLTRTQCRATSSKHAFTTFRGSFQCIVSLPLLSIVVAIIHCHRTTTINHYQSMHVLFLPSGLSLNILLHHWQSVSTLSCAFIRSSV